MNYGSYYRQCPIGTTPYTVIEGETFYTIAKKFNTTVNEITTANPNINPQNLSGGDILCIPQRKPSQTFCPSANFYVIVEGDSFYSIAQKFNISVQDLAKANSGINPANLYGGLVICIPLTPSPVSITVNVQSKLLILYRGGRMVKTYPVAVGKLTTPTPKGTFTIVNKQVNPGGPFGSRWMGLSKPTYGIHGTNNPASIGKNASNGCIRMHNRDVNELFNSVSIGTVVRIV